LNIAPGPDGDLAARDLEQLRTIGDHLRALRPIDIGGPVSGLPWTQFGEVTGRDGAIYLHVFNGDDDRLVYCGIRNRVSAARLVTPHIRTLSVTQDDGHIVIDGLSGARTGPLGYVVELAIDGAPTPLIDGHQDLQF
jgi:hypothetical protein